MSNGIPVVEPNRLVYIMSPYTHFDSGVMNYRAEIAAAVIADLMLTNRYPGTTLFSPIVHYHQVAIHRNELPRDVGYWWRINLPFMKAANAALVLCIPGWKESSGIHRELSWFRTHRRSRKDKIQIDFFDCDWREY